LGPECLRVDPLGDPRIARDASDHGCGRHVGAHGADVHAACHASPLQRCRRQRVLLVLRRALLAAALFSHLLGAAIMNVRVWREGVGVAGLIGGPAAWAVSTQLNYALAPLACRYTTLIIALPAAALVLLAVAGGFLSWEQM